MSVYIVTIVLIFAVMLFGILVDRLYRAFAARHPQLGPFRKSEGCGSCSGGSGCSSEGGGKRSGDHSCAD